LGEADVRDGINHRYRPYIGPKLKAALDWLHEKDQDRRAREDKVFHYTRWTLVAAVAAVFVGIASVVVTLLH
jgi:hypothetical protein